MSVPLNQCSEPTQRYVTCSNSFNQNVLTKQRDMPGLLNDSQSLFASSATEFQWLVNLSMQIIGGWHLSMRVGR
jgi:hypothetical protein